MTVVERLLLGEVVLLVALTFGLLLWLGQVRVPMVARGEIRIKDIALDRGGWPDHAKQLGNAFDNQFQLPVLFYIAVMLTLWFGVAGWVEVILGAVFVVARYVHAFIHATSNHVPRRFAAYAASMAVLGLYWLVLAWLILTLPGAPG